MTSTTPVSTLPRAGKIYATRLEKLNIHTFADLLSHIPTRYADYSLISSISSLQAGEVVTVRGKVVEMKNNYLSKFKTIQRGVLKDLTGEIKLTWFNQPFLSKNIAMGDCLSVSGKVELFASKFALQNPEYEKITGQETIHTGRLVPIYPETRGISSKWLRKHIRILLQNLPIEEFLPKEFLTQYDLLDLPKAYSLIHFPTSLEDTVLAKKRLAFDELLLLGLLALSKKNEWQRQLTREPFIVEKNNKNVEEFINSLPFHLTSSQEQAFADIKADFKKPTPMNRLLQGDVGSGKTIVACLAMYLCFLNKKQAILMSPTEILAKQHYDSISKLLHDKGVVVQLATGSKKIDSTQKTDILIGTHALLNEAINLPDVGLVIIDEQQRFGVKQRGVLRQKGISPHLLTMTATPIPRTMALAAYGNLDLSYLNEMPKNRKTIKTWLVPTNKREGAYTWIEKEIRDNASQAFVICPLIEESENLQSVKSAKQEFERLQADIFPKLRLALLHGKLKAKDKEQILSDFREHKYDILVATPVVEVGIDIPNATVIVIEAAERFGLAQLHQLRGRVGRGDKQSYCLLFTETESENTKLRLKAMESTILGSKLAELDLKLRGSGDLYGTAQHGRNLLKIASFADGELIAKTQQAASAIYTKLDTNPKLKQKLAEMEKVFISPD